MRLFGTLDCAANSRFDRAGWITIPFDIRNIPGPYTCVAGEIFTPGFAAGEIFTPGARTAELFTPGAAAAQLADSELDTCP